MLALALAPFGEAAPFLWRCCADEDKSGAAAAESCVVVVVVGGGFRGARSGSDAAAGREP